MRSEKSKCCHSDVKVVGDTTKYYVCLKCNKPCDIEEKLKKKVNNKKTCQK